MAVTLKDIAKACGVSRGTVDRALNGKSRIHPHTKEKVLAMADEMGYKPDLIARSLVKGQSMSVGVIVFDILNRYFAQMVNAIGVEARNNGYSIEFMLQERNLQLELNLINTLVGRRIDGLILCPVNKGKHFIEFLSKLSVPAVVIGNKLNNKIPFIGIDEYAAAKDAANFIISKRYRRIIFVCPPLQDMEAENIFSHEQRLDGFLSVMTNQSVVGYEVISHWNYFEEARELLLQEDKRTAFFCSGDIYALELMNYLQSFNLYAPKDYGIMGYDGIDTLKYIAPGLATVRTPLEEIGTTAFASIIALINNQEIAKQQLLPYQIINGDSL